MNFLGLSIGCLGFAALQSTLVLAGPVQPSLALPQRVAHCLDRLAFGARPGDAERLRSQGPEGIRRWVDQQLHPERIDDADLEKKLSHFKAPAMLPRELREQYLIPSKVAENMGISSAEFSENEELKKQIREKIGEDRLPDAIPREMLTARLIRAVESRRQLQEVLIDFWLNHFNIDVNKGEEKWLLPEFEREVIRKNIFGYFQGLLSATVHSPAMLFYLDNQGSQSPIDYSRKLKPGEAPRKRDQGLNENYARELLELHTLGVDGGYTQGDVTELARILTGWSIDKLNEDPQFKFKEKVHDRGEKKFLGRTFEAGSGIEEGEAAIEQLAKHPATARFISRKLARYFVADDPPATLVNRLATVFTRTAGDLRAVYSELFSSPEFWSPKAYRSKIKRPLQLVLSSIRALGGEVDLKSDLNRVLSAMGEEPYRCAPPTGYKDDAEAWVNPGAMVSRLNLAVRLASNRVEGVFVQLPRLARVPADSAALVHALEGRLLHEKLSPGSRSVVIREVAGESQSMAEGETRPLNIAKVVGLILGSPEFQRR